MNHSADISPLDGNNYRKQKKEESFVNMKTNKQY